MQHKLKKMFIYKALIVFQTILGEFYLPTQGGIRQVPIAAAGFQNLRFRKKLPVLAGVTPSRHFRKMEN